MAVYPINDTQLVDRLGELTNSDLDEIFSLINTDQESSKKHPFPCPTSYRTAITHYVEITAMPRTHILRELVEYCSDEEVRCFLFFFLEKTYSYRILTKPTITNQIVPLDKYKY